MEVVCCYCLRSSEVVRPVSWWRSSWDLGIAKVACCHCGSSSWVSKVASSPFLLSPNFPDRLSSHDESCSVFGFSRKAHRRAQFFARLCVKQVGQRAIERAVALIQDKWRPREEFARNFEAQLETAGASDDSTSSSMKDFYHRYSLTGCEQERQLSSYLNSPEASIRASMRISKAEDTLDSAIEVCLRALDGEIWFRDKFGDQDGEISPSQDVAPPWINMSRGQLGRWRELFGALLLKRTVRLCRGMGNGQGPASRVVGSANLMRVISSFLISSRDLAEGTAKDLAEYCRAVRQPHFSYCNRPLKVCLCPLNIFPIRRLTSSQIQLQSWLRQWERESCLGPWASLVWRFLGYCPVCDMSISRGRVYWCCSYGPHNDDDDSYDYDYCRL
uniref:Uncharacterized protein n=1 Tax=Chromera velia CCMP2878 TaxID=1169474 RepID=A0A0G4FUE4_9ALVE|eukprot:Cvel_18830.t1-p1 / transcript=Cvel_18830.t1 / gene=Cvel_18830 / organism=Chromera_velia_CCMP2878 / gene_product=hypothetical protein / transcript_product=hypothetical protein / location=Cvel_scaffold1582:8067-9227(+) / protein_length=387 / sequence_SO=supercontig / SO=protein_coding / is_pseudo=false